MKSQRTSNGLKPPIPKDTKSAKKENIIGFLYQGF